MVDELFESPKLFFDNETIAAGANTKSDWIRLHEFFAAHGINGKFAGTGTLKIEYMVTAVEDENYGNWTTRLAAALATRDSPFEKGLILSPNKYIKFRATETGGVNSITGLSVYLTQTGGSRY